MAAQRLCFRASGVRPRNVEPGLNSAPSFLPSKLGAASGRGVQTCWGGREKSDGSLESLCVFPGLVACSLHLPKDSLKAQKTA